ncbi:glycoside hydrolase [Daldinia decipiens]|uniref:glycoside hydrolase n=1 Tax=Daldinia decipiens TaxID=326647 RepID=UPI0020C392D3|nr:glycoside hydrolase [Daldinia decipiens]KAI1653895.1 glycoside hydrolase [Daldinia decipiens]
MISKTILYGLVLTSSAPAALGHWTYSRLIVNNEVVGEPWQYIRQHNNSNAPLTNVNSINFRCNVDAKPAETHTVRAGDKVGFRINKHFGHPGIQQVYLSRAPEGITAADYDGSGGWARVYSLTSSPTNSTNSSSTNDDKILTWATHNIETFRFALPTSTPPGEYLLRAEGLALHAAHKWAQAQFYVSCAQIKVVAGEEDVTKTGADVREEDLGPLVKIPGMYRGDEPGILIPVFWSSLTNYTAPGPALWPEGTQEQHIVEQL